MSSGFVKKVTVLGSTGSIGRQAIEVILAHPDRFSLFGLSACHNDDALIRQAQTLHPRVVACPAVRDAEQLPPGTELISGADAATALAGMAEADIVVLGISGLAALPPLLAAIGAKKRIAIANKESLVCGGALVDAALKANAGAELIPVDSEQSALFQCLSNGKTAEIARLVLTASGGPFLFAAAEEMARADETAVLRHPTWKMGKKITLDSATMFNKGLEIIEAARLFHVPGERIAVLIHPESVIHSMVEYRDGSVFADLGCPDMRLPIQYAMTYPDRIYSPVRPLRLEEYGKLSFYAPDFDRFPAIPLAYEALRRENGYPVVYNGANERAAELFFAGEIAFLDIAALVSGALDAYPGARMDSIESVWAADAFARGAVDAQWKKRGKNA